MFRNIKVSSCIIGLTGSIILAFGLYHVHSCSGVTEGGVLGMTLLLQYWFHISPAVTGFVLNSACYLFGAKQLGKEFIFYSALSTAGFSLAYNVLHLSPMISKVVISVAVLVANYVLSKLFVFRKKQ